MTYKRIIPGLVITLPRDKQHCGVILDATRTKNGWFRVTLVLCNGDVATCGLKMKGDSFLYREYHSYDTAAISNMLENKNF